MAKPRHRLIVMTGVSKGLGLAMTHKFIELGHTILGCARSRYNIESLQEQYGAPHDFAAVDVASESQVERWAARILSSHGVPDLLINNAAIINKNAPLWQVPGEEFSKLIDINIKGVANIIRHLVPAMVGAKSGIIVNFSSEWGRSVSSEVAPYCASKWAIEGLTQALAKEIPRPMAAVPVSPGVIDTDMLRSCFGEGASRYPSPQEWVDSAVSYLLGLNSRDNGKPGRVPM